MKLSDINIRDPFVLLHEGQYYLYGTRGATCWGKADGFDAYVSDDLVTWSEPHEIFHNDGSFWADRNYWAPEVHQWQGAFYMFASFKAEGVCRGTCILKADNPLGPFVPHSDGPVTPADWECLDGTFYVDRQGKPWMVFCHEWVQAIDGEIQALPLTDDLSAPAGSPRLLFTASEAEWIVPGRPVQGKPSFVTDGPFMWRTADGELLMLWASFSKEGYTQGLARSTNGEIDGKFVQIDPLFMKDGGHGMVFRTKEGKLMLTLHSPNTTLEERPVFFELKEKRGPEGSLTVPARRARLIPINDRVTLIDDAGESTCYLICGDDRALLVDSVNGEEDLMAVVRTITDLPVIVVNTHGHPDHIGSSKYFGEVYLAPEDADLAATFIAERGDAAEFPAFRPVHAGDVFDLGGVQLEAVDLRGHTAGSIGLLDKGDRILYTGDAINTHLWMQLDHSLPLKALQGSLTALLRDHGGDFDHILHGHATGLLRGSWAQDLLQGCEELLAGQQDKDLPYHYFGGECRQHPVRGIDGAVIVYTDGKL